MGAFLPEPALRSFRIHGPILQKTATLRGPFLARIPVAVKPAPCPVAFVLVASLKTTLSLIVSIAATLTVKPIPVWVLAPLVLRGFLFRWRFRRAFAHTERPLMRDRKICWIWFFKVVGIHPEVTVGVVGSED